MRIFAAAALAIALASPALAADNEGANAGRLQVYNEQNEKLGEAHEMLVSTSGQVEGLVVTVAIEGEDSPGDEVVVPLDLLKVTEDGDDSSRIVVTATKDEFKAMPKVRNAEPGQRSDDKI